MCIVTIGPKHGLVSAAIVPNRRLAMNKKPSRLIKILAASATLLALVVALAFFPPVQTAIARRVLAGLPGTTAKVERVAIGLGRIDVRGLVIRQAGVSIDLPSAEMKVALLDAVRERVRIESLVARGWTVELASTAGTPPDGKASGEGPSRPFEGIFQMLRLPVDLRIDRIDLAGEVVFPQAGGGGPGRAEVVIQGGRIGAGGDGRVTLAADARLPGAGCPVSEVSIRSTVAVAMDTPRTFRSLSFSADAAATGQQFPDGARLSARVSASHGENGEDYALNLSLPDANGGRHLVDFSAANRDGSADLTGRWTLDIRDADIAPFTLGLALPAFAAGGEGTFASDRAFSRTKAAGKLAVSLDKLDVLMPALAAVGALDLTADFDISHRDTAVRVNRFSATLAGGAPVAALEALQVIELDHNTGALKVADPASGLARVDLRGLPLAWAQPLLGGVTLAGGPLRGEFVVSAQNGGFVLRSTAPVTLSRLSVARDGHALVSELGVSAAFTAGYSPAGWQAELPEVVVTGGAAALATVSLKAAQPLDGTGRPVAVAGRLHADLPALFAQPAAAGLVTLLRGTADVDFTATAAGKSVKIDAKCALSGLAAGDGRTLPAISGDLRADLVDGGKVDVQLPLVIEHNSRRSDIELAASLHPDDGRQALNAQLIGNELYVEDLMLLAALAPSKGGAAAPATAPQTTAPASAAAPWDAVTGRLNFALKKVVYSADFEVRDITGSIKLTPGLLSLETLRTTLPSGGEAKVSGALKYDGSTVKPYVASADVEVTSFDPATVVSTGNADKKPVVEGKFDIKGAISGQSATLAGIADTATADMQLTSRGGKFHGFNTSALTGYLGAAQKAVSTTTRIINTLGSLTGLGKGNVELERARAVADTVGRLVEINFDQLNINAAWRPGQDIAVTDLSLISPDLRLTGAGLVGNAKDVRLVRQSINLDLNMAVRGDLAADLRVLNRLKTEADALGYTPLVEAFNVDGTLLQMGWASFVKMLGPRLE